MTKAPGQHVTVDVVLSPKEATEEPAVRTAALRAAKISAQSVRDLRVVKRSIDARARQPRMQLRVEISTSEPFDPPITTPPSR